MAPKPSTLFEILRQRASEISKPLDVLASIRAQATLGQYIFADDAAAVANSDLEHEGDIETLLIERAVMRVVVEDLKAAGWLQQEFDPVTVLDRWEQQGWTELFKESKTAWLQFEFGNGVDVLTDFSGNLKEALPRYTAMWEQLSEHAAA